MQANQGTCFDTVGISRLCLFYTWSMLVIKALIPRVSYYSACFRLASTKNFRCGSGLFVSIQHKHFQEFGAGGLSLGDLPFLRLGIPRQNRYGFFGRSFFSLLVKGLIGKRLSSRAHGKMIINCPQKHLRGLGVKGCKGWVLDWPKVQGVDVRSLVVKRYVHTCTITPLNILEGKPENAFSCDSNGQIFKNLDCIGINMIDDG